MTPSSAKEPKRPATKKPAAAKKAAAKKAAAPKKPAARKKAAPADPMRIIALAAAQFAIDKKASNVKLIDLRAVTAITDYFVVASGSSDTQVKAIADNVMAEMRKQDYVPWKSEGWDAKQWIIIDFVDLVVHVFHQTAREFYNLERLWADAPTEVIEDKLAKSKKRGTK
jgi:ribosome-associated protein